MTEEVKPTPKLRFDGFSKNWQKVEFKELYRFQSTNSLSRDKLNYDSGLVKNIHYGDIHTKFRTLFNIDDEEVPFINEDVETSKFTDDQFLNEGDLVIADASEDYNDIGKAIEILNLNDQLIVAGLHTFHAKRKSQDIQIGFSAYLLQTHSIRSQVMRIAQGTKVLGISTKRYGQLQLSIPSLPEQQKIASFLTAIDQRIQLLEKKKAKLEEYKKGVMQKLFSQEIRFKGDDGKEFPDWKEKRLGEICTKQSSNISANSLDESSGEYKIYGATGFLQYVDFFNVDTSYISIVKDGAGVGRILLCEPNSSVLGTLDILIPKQGNCIGFLFALISNIRFTKYITGSTIPHIYFKDYSKEKLMVPSSEEQEKIAAFLNTLNKSISSIRSEIEGSTEYKKGLLQKMFV